MESNDGADDQSSGWLLVKKKQRSSPKFSVNSWVGGLSTKKISRCQHNQPSLGAKLDAGNYVDQLSKASRDAVVFDSGVRLEESDCKSGDAQNQPQGIDGCSQTNNSDALAKIKWGDLDENTLLLHQEENLESDIMVCSSGSPSVVCMNGEDSNGSFGHPFLDHKEDRVVAKSVDEDLSRLHSELPRNKSLENQSKEADIVPLGDVKMQNVDDENVEENSSVSCCNGHFENKETYNFDSTYQSQRNIPCAETIHMHPEAAVVSENGCSKVPQTLAGTTQSMSGINVASPVTEEASIIEAPSESCKVGCSEVSDMPVVDGNSKTTVPFRDSMSTQPNKTAVASTAESTVAMTTEDVKCQPSDASLDALMKTGSMDCIDAHGDESKERFRERLWCFLFENLNRAVDELYLLCELECDVDQMKEAILVLEEAAFDFKELNSRVEGFEKVKKSTSHIPEGSSLTMKADHRRPHALSWEVRRMTTSPHRADILSSSLEAFRKIQEQRASTHACDAKTVGPMISNGKESISKLKKQHAISEIPLRNSSKEKKAVVTSRSSSNASGLPHREQSPAVVVGKNKLVASSGTEKQPTTKKDKLLADCITLKNSKSVESLKRHVPFSDREKEKQNGALWKSMDAWKEKRNWEEILAPTHRVSSSSSRFSHSPSLSRRSAERARILHDKLMSPEKKKKSVLDLKKEADEKHARATRIRNELESERVQRLQRTSVKLNRVNEFQAERNLKLREDLYARHQRSESRHEAHLAQVVRRANDESSKVNEVRFITSLNEENKKHILRQKLHDSGLRRAEKLQLLKTKQREDIAREEAVLERKKLLEAEKLQRLAEIQKKKEEAQVRREEERKASSAAREAKAIEQMRRKESRAKAQQEEAELLAHKLAERLSESEQRRKFYLEQIRERASMDFRDQTSPFLRRSLNKEGQVRCLPNSTNDDSQANNRSDSGACTLPANNMNLQPPIKRRIKRIRQKLMSLKHEYPESLFGAELSSIGYRTAVGTARAKIGRWLQELQKLRQARKEGAATFGLITTEMIKFLEGRDAELQAACQAGLLDFIASALPASHALKPEACQITLCLLRLLNVVLMAPGNRSYFISQNLLPPVIPILAAALENYIKIAASSNTSGSISLSSSKLSSDMSDSISEVLDGFLLTVATIMGHISYNEQQIQMLDGLLELVISYQVIHRLRDLFALYDRPQVEGSPFPSSIMLSIKLLDALTYRFRNFSSIDWNSFVKDVTSINGSEMVEVADTVESKVSPDVPEHRKLDESIKIKKDGELSVRKTCDEFDCSNSKIANVDNKDEPAGTSVNDNVGCSVSLMEDGRSADKGAGQKDEVRLGLKQPVEYLLSAMSETGLVCLPSMLTAVLLQANNKSSSEPVAYVLPSNFEEVATGVLKVLNNLAEIDLTFIQKMLARPDLKMEIFHLSSFLLSHCTSKWGGATDQIGMLLLETLFLLGYFALFHCENQAVLRWGKSPTILHKVCDLPFVFFSDPELMPILASTLAAACFGCEQNRSVILQELSLDMVISLLKSWRNSLPAPAPAQPDDPPPPPPPVYNETGESNQPSSECRKLQGDTPQRSHRYMRSGRTVSQKGVVATNNNNNNRGMKIKNQRENKVQKLSEETGQKNNNNLTFALMLHARFPGSIIDKAEHFFSAELITAGEVNTYDP